MCTCSYEDTKLVENTLPAESDCPWCDAKAGDTHARSCPNGERYKQVQQLTQSGKSLPEIIPDYMEKAWGEFADSLSSAASKLGRLGGLVKSEAKSSSSRVNGRKGGRPKSTKSIDMEDI